MKKLIIKLLLVILGGSGAVVGIDKLGSASNKFEKPTNTFTSAGLVATQLSALNYNRQYERIINIGTSTAWIWLNTSTDYVVAGQGIPLAPMSTTTPNYDNSTFVIDVNNLYFGPIQTIASDYTRLFMIEK